MLATAEQSAGKRMAESRESGAPQGVTGTGGLSVPACFSFTAGLDTGDRSANFDRSRRPRLVA